jgi:hypothetical protein
MKFTRNKHSFGKKAELLVLSLLLLLLIYKIFTQNFLLAQESTDSSTPDSTVKESIKERLEKAVSDETIVVKIKKAWVGNLESIANHTLTIDTKEGPKLASISAETTYIRLPKRTSVKAEDLEINSFTIAIGFLNGNPYLLEITKDTQITQSRDNEIQEATVEDFVKNRKAVIIAESSQDDSQESTTLLNILLFPLSQEEETPIPVELETEEADEAESLSN